jgi:hypothetical protein
LVSSHRVSWAALPCVLALSGCGGRFLAVDILPVTCVTPSDDVVPECAPPTRFAWDKANARIVYPALLEQAGVAGSVTAALWINRNGAVDSVIIVSSTDRRFVSAVKGPVTSWRFRRFAGTGQVLPLEVLFRLGGCPEPRSRRQTPVSLRTSLQVEVAACLVTYRRSISLPHSQTGR